MAWPGFWFYFCEFLLDLLGLFSWVIIRSLDLVYCIVQLFSQV